MRLQLRVRHALGARMMDIEPRPAARPIVIGRTPGADVQVPVGTVGERHCLLYMEGEQWVIRDGGGGAGTFVNGGQIDGAAYLQLGDVISLGPGQGAPTIEVDPMGTGRRQMAAAGPARPTMPVEQETQAFYPGTQPAVEVPQEQIAEPENVDWMGGSSSATSYRRRRPQKKQGSYVGVTIAGALAVILVGWFIVAKMTRDDEPAPAVRNDAPQDVRGGGRGGKNIFEFPETDKPKPKAIGDGTVPPQIAVSNADDAPKPKAVVDNDPERQTDEWKAVLDANAESEKPGKALWTIVDYRRLHPGKFEGELKQYEDAAFDRLWWERIKELCDLRDSLDSDIQKKNVEIAQETEAGFAAKLEKEKKLLLDRRQGVGEILTQEMGYAAKEVPNIFDSAQMAKLRSQRIPETYEGWKKRVVSSLIRTRNLPWERVR